MQSEKQLRYALTLVELLVTITIMGLVIAISVPMVKPMLASNKVKSGADIVAGFLAQARNRAIEEGRPVGVTFERVLNYADGNIYPYNGASVLMRQVAEPKPLSGFVKDVRVAVDCSSGIGQIDFYSWQRVSPGPPELWDWVLTNTEATYWDKLVETGDQIQFDGKGPKYEITKSAGFQINMNTVANRNLAPPVYLGQQPALFKVFRKPQPGKVAPTMAPPVAMPEGIVVDLDCSGMGTRFYDKSEGNNWNVACDEFCAAGSSDTNSVTIMFSPTGEVDRVYSSNTGSVIPTGPIFLNIGIWERAGFWNEGGTAISNDYIPDPRPDNTDGGKYIRNYLDLNNYWVTVFPRTGAVRVNRVASTTYLDVNGNVQYADLNNGKAYRYSREFANSMHGAETR
ncbi:MAG: hypothetical protein FWH27_16305 [Planctomycetaceae bacterium]|nr:hypothetical protein [Planctomycetaceae bacterium]